MPCGDVLTVPVCEQSRDLDLGIGVQGVEPCGLDLLDPVGVYAHLSDALGNRSACGEVGAEQRVERMRCQERDAPCLDPEVVAQRIGRQEPKSRNASSP